jgi:hypothetical protein
LTSERRFGPKLGGLIDDDPEGREAEGQCEERAFGHATILTAFTCLN